MSENRMLEGSLIRNGDASDECWTTVEQFLDLLINKIGVQFPAKAGDDFLIYGFETPGEDEKEKLWFRTDRADHFVGFFIFINGKWQRIYDHSDQDVIWKTGDSRTIEPGFQLIDGTVASIDVDTQAFIQGQYRVNPDASTPSETVYSYFATVYVGL